MHIDEAIRSRRAVKGYDPAFSLSREEKDELLQLAVRVSATLPAGTIGLPVGISGIVLPVGKTAFVGAAA